MKLVLIDGEFADAVDLTPDQDAYIEQVYAEDDDIRSFADIARRAIEQARLARQAEGDQDGPGQ